MQGGGVERFRPATAHSRDFPPRNIDGCIDTADHRLFGLASWPMLPIWRTTERLVDSDLWNQSCTVTVRRLLKGREVPPLYVHRCVASLKQLHSWDYAAEADVGSEQLLATGRY